MTDRPIIFSAPMVRALLDGRKSMTRRVLRHKSIDIGIAQRVEVDDPIWIQFCHPKGGPLTCVKWPYVPGDRLYVREAHAFDGPIVRYYATDHVHELRRKRQSIHMPRWASRLTLLVTNVRVQRLQEISEADSVAEGIESDRYGAWRCYASEPKNQTHWADAVESYRTLWNSLHGPGAWAANPWVAALNFTVHRCNIDQMEAK